MCFSDKNGEKEVASPEDLAREWRVKWGYVGRGGLVLVYEDEIQGWLDRLRDPDHWIPGVIAFDEDGNSWLTAGGTRAGADKWVPNLRVV